MKSMKSYGPIQVFEIFGQISMYETQRVTKYMQKIYIHMSHFASACKTEGQNGISRLISELLRTLDSSLRDRLFVLQNEVF